jgi:hypothetical protein
MSEDSGPVDRTSPVATREYLADLRGEELLRWRTAPFAGRPDAAARGIDLPLPFGWFAVCYSDELTVGQVRAVRYFGRELALWRGADGLPRMLDAYCRHLGANMAWRPRARDYLGVPVPFRALRWLRRGARDSLREGHRRRRGAMRHWPVVEEPPCGPGITRTR